MSSEYEAFGPVSPMESLRQPEVEFGMTEILDKVADKVEGCPEAAMQVSEGPEAGALVHAEHFIQTTYPFSEYGALQRRDMALYNPKEDRTVVIEATDWSVDDEHKVSYLVEFYKGIPFGGIYEPGEDTQFAARPETHLKGPDEVQVEQTHDPLFSVTAIRDTPKGPIRGLEVEGRNAVGDDEIQLADVESMQRWLEGADAPLPIIPGMFF